MEGTHADAARSLVVILGALFALADCEGVPDIQFGDGGSEASDDAGDGAPPPPADDGGLAEAALLCGDAAVASCAQCTGAPFECSSAGRCAASCKNDCGDPVECIGCDGGDNAVVYRCMPAADAAGCIGGGVARCEAQNDVTDCPGLRQVRLNDHCYACGEPGTSGQDCRGGMRCSTSGTNAFECR